MTAIAAAIISLFIGFAFGRCFRNGAQWHKVKFAGRSQSSDATYYGVTVDERRYLFSSAETWEAHDRAFVNWPK